MFQKYASYQTADFVADSDFIEWVRRPTSSSNQFWEEFLEVFPHQHSALQQARQVVRLLIDESRAIPANPQDAEEIWESIEEGLNVKPIRRIGYSTEGWQRFAAAAAIVLALGIGWYFVWPLQSTPMGTYQALVEEAESIQPLEEVANTSIQPRLVNLPDGSTITLEKESRVSFAKSFEGKTRKVYLTGAAFFDVAKNPDKPFLVYSNELVTKVLGTSFRIQAFEKAKDVVVSVKSGRVSVYPKNSSKNADRLVFGCDDSAQKEFLNTRKIKGDIGGPGQSNSNLWFTTFDKPDQLGPNTAQGAVWLSENVGANQPSDPFLFAGWDNRMAWVKNEGVQTAMFTFEVDKEGKGDWQTISSFKVQPNEARAIIFEEKDQGEWVRVKSSHATKATVNFNYSDASRFAPSQDKIFAGLSAIGTSDYLGGQMYGLGDNRRVLGLLASEFKNGKYTESGYYELDSQMNLVKKDDPETAKFIREKFAIPKNVITVENASVLIVDDSGRRWRLPLGDAEFTKKINAGQLRIAREVATERDLLDAHGTFYELPAENADGFAKIRPVASHSLSIHDYASYRGLLVMTGLDKNASAGEHIISPDDGKAKIWAGTIDDLWKLGKPVGHGGLWKDAQVKANMPSDPYLIGFYDKKSLKLSHKSPQSVTFKIQVNPIGHGPWMTYQEVTVKPGETLTHDFPKEFEARWIRFESSRDCVATAALVYE